MTTELDTILDTIDDWTDRGIDFALATVVGVRGSTYRGLGARQLLSPPGTSVGTVSGGCLDSELAAAARQVIETGTPQVLEFDLTADDEAVWGWGIGCNGVTVVSLEPPTPSMALATGLRRLRSRTEGGVVVHEVTPSGRRWFPWDDLPDELVPAAGEALRRGRSAVVETGDGARFMLEVLGRPPRLLVCGAGHDAVPLVRLAHEMGYEVLVVDDRRAFLTDDRFPEASALVAAEPAELAAAIELDARTHAVLITHNYLRDLEYLRSLVSTDVAYIGALGPGERLARLIDDLRADGVELSPSDLEKLHGPAGLDIGAEGPLEIAWSILSEILAIRREKAAGFLRDRKGPAPVRGAASTSG